MSDITRNAMDTLHSGVESVVFTDFPDHANVGDSAIALGELAYWRDSGVSVLDTYSAPALPRSSFRAKTPVFIHGGGNLGGLYPPLSEHRYSLAESLVAETLLIQGPQSVHFVNDAAHEEFRIRMARRRNLRVGVRDKYSFELVRRDIDELFLVPDAVHLLGEIDAPAPTQKVVELSRTDIERTSTPAPGGVDWIRDDRGLAISSWLSWRSKQVPAVKLAFRRPTQWWERRAEIRFLRGVSVLARGETIRTDRLHAMLIGLQMGRNVIARDNSNGKLSRYARSWFADSPPPNLSWEGKDWRDS